MSDISIPGVKSKYDTEKLIEGLMAVERIPKTRAEERLKEMQLQRTTWLDLNRRLSSLRESSRALFSFQNPFNERVASSTDEAVITGTATREAIEETKSFLVKRIASADRFMSDSIAADAKVPKGDYVFSVGEKAIKLSYGGGSLKDFVDAINRKGADTVRAQLVAVRSDARVLVIESLKTGAANRLGFSGAAEDFALSFGLVEKASSTLRNLPVDAPARFERPLDTAKVLSKEDVLFVGPGAEAALKLPSPVSTSGLVLELEVELSDRPASDPVADGPPSGPAIPATGAMEYEGIRIDSAPSEAILPEWAPPPAPSTRDDFSPLYLIDGSGRSTALPAVAAGAGFKTISVPLPVYMDTFTGIGVRNGNTGRDLRVRAARVYDPTETAGMRPKNPVQTARDAVVVMDGIEVTRPDNAISDLVPGLTVNLWQESDKPVKLKIEPNREAAKESLIELVGNYNRLLAELNIVARPDEKILDEIEYFTDDEKKKYTERLGLFQGDTTLSQLRSSLQRTMMDAYPTTSGPHQLAEFGISTDSRRGGSYDASRLRGYLEIDETALDKALLDNFSGVKDLFGFDTDGDLLTDAGAAFKLDAMMKAYVETGGIVNIRTQTIDNQITRQKKDIENLETQLARKEDDLKRKYGLMESALGQMESSSSAWDSFGNSQGK
ncbi:MAG: flagellar hook protein [Spirochaetae bacterium HGW-Spirochaetae-3]|jgi:flagellar hook-associated protein 2|nr:MAG: flagellar hook protein [Spirochaetae bacterium HGW-Spirochaetae-3]